MPRLQFTMAQRKRAREKVEKRRRLGGFRRGRQSLPWTKRRDADPMGYSHCGTKKILCVSRESIRIPEGLPA